MAGSDVKAKRVTATGALSVGRSRLRMILVTTTGAGAGRLTLTDGDGGATTVDVDLATSRKRVSCSPPIYMSQQPPTSRLRLSSGHKVGPILW